MFITIKIFKNSKLNSCKEILTTFSLVSSITSIWMVGEIHQNERFIFFSCKLDLSHQVYNPCIDVFLVYSMQWNSIFFSPCTHYQTFLLLAWGNLLRKTTLLPLWAVCITPSVLYHHGRELDIWLVEGEKISPKSNTLLLAWVLLSSDLIS